MRRDMSRRGRLVDPSQTSSHLISSHLISSRLVSSRLMTAFIPDRVGQQVHLGFLTITQLIAKTHQFKIHPVQTPIDFKIIVTPNPRAFAALAQRVRTNEVESPRGEREAPSAGERAQVWRTNCGLWKSSSLVLELAANGYPPAFVRPNQERLGWVGTEGMPKARAKPHNRRVRLLFSPEVL